MTATPQTKALETWLRSHGAYLHPNTRIVKDSDRGIHRQATAPIPPGTTIASAPHSLALSPLNALIDDAFPVFRQQRHRFKVEAMGFFYLIAQYIHRNNSPGGPSESFWKPYLDALPGPDMEFSQPLFFEEAEEVVWLEGTDVWHTNLARKEVYQKYYRDGLAVIEQAGIDTEPYTW